MPPKTDPFSQFGLFYKGFDEQKRGFDLQYLGQSARSWKILRVPGGSKNLSKSLSKIFRETLSIEEFSSTAGDMQQDSAVVGLS